MIGHGDAGQTGHRSRLRTATLKIAAVCGLGHASTVEKRPGRRQSRAPWRLHTGLHARIAAQKVAARGGGDRPHQGMVALPLPRRVSGGTSPWLRVGQNQGNSQRRREPGLNGAAMFGRKAASNSPRNILPRSSDYLDHIAGRVCAFGGAFLRRKCPFGPFDRLMDFKGQPIHQV